MTCSSGVSGPGRATVPSGDVSVIPQAWMIVMPSSSKPRISASGTADPPTAIRSREARRAGLIVPARTASRTPYQTVGTAADTVTPAASTRAVTDSGSMCIDGIASDAPVRRAA